MSYWDTSALIKLYVPETDSQDFANYAQDHPIAFTAQLTAWEALTTFRRKEAEGVIQPGAARSLHEYLLKSGEAGLCCWVELSPVVESEFGNILNRCFQQKPPLLIRTLDAVHLACAKAAGETEIVATDRRLRAVAAFLGFTLFPK